MAEEKISKEQIKKLNEKKDLETIANTPEGQRFLKRLAISFYIFSSTYDKDLEVRNFKEGARLAFDPFWKELVAIDPELAVKIVIIK